MGGLSTRVCYSSHRSFSKSSLRFNDKGIDAPRRSRHYVHHIKGTASLFLPCFFCSCEIQDVSPPETGFEVLNVKSGSLDIILGKKHLLTSKAGRYLETLAWTQH